MPVKGTIGECTRARSPTGRAVLVAVCAPSASAADDDKAGRVKFVKRADEICQPHRETTPRRPVDRQRDQAADPRGIRASRSAGRDVRPRLPRAARRPTAASPELPRPGRLPHADRRSGCDRELHATAVGVPRRSKALRRGHRFARARAARDRRAALLEQNAPRGPCATSTSSTAGRSERRLAGSRLNVTFRLRAPRIGCSCNALE